MDNPKASSRTRRDQGSAPGGSSGGARHSLLLFAANLLLVGGGLALLFGAAGTIRWARGWAYVALLVLSLSAHRVYVAHRNPGLLARRQRIGEGTKSWDKVWNALFWPLMLSVVTTSALDVERFHASVMPPALWLLGALMLSGGMALSAWAMGSNPYFEGTVRIQTELDHRVIDTGPYAWIRHPGYVGLILWALATPFLLGSWYALAPAGVVTGWIVLRTALEDATLRRELAGYDAYTRRVRYRLVPRLW